MRATRIIGCSIATLAIAGMATAAPIQKGSSILAIQITEGQADLVEGNINAFSNSEMGVQAQFWHFMTDEYAFNAAAGIGYFREADTADPNLVGGQNATYTQDSWQVRVGGDRVGHINDRFHLFAGPGIQIWSGKWKLDRSGQEVESPSTTRYGLSGRMGAHLKMGESFGLMAQLGHYWAYATAENGEAKAKWLPSGHDGSVGVAFNF